MKRKITSRELFLTGAGACIGAYAIFFLKSYKVVFSFVRENGSFAIAMFALALSVLACMSGIWSLFCESKTIKAAFLSGLGFPGLMFGASFGFPGPLPAKNQVQAESRVLYKAALLPVFANISPVMGQAFKLVFNPFGSVLEQSRKQVLIANQQTEQATDAALVFAALLSPADNPLSLTNALPLPSTNSLSPTNSTSLTNAYPSTNVVTTKTNQWMIASYDGNIEVIAVSGAAKRVTAPNYLLAEGETVRTGPRSRARIYSPSGMILALGDLSAVVIPGAENQPRVRAKAGRFFLFSREKPNEIQIQTPTATAAIRG